jgi:hypothetical protein
MSLWTPSHTYEGGGTATAPNAPTRFDRFLMWFGLPRWSAPSAEDACIDQQSYYDSVEATQRRLARLEAAVEREKYRVAGVVGSWAKDTVRKRGRAAINCRISPEITAWLPGLCAEEIIKLAKASTFDIQIHIFGFERINGVRRVQPLEECTLVFPRPVLNPDYDGRSAGGGLRRSR